MQKPKLSVLIPVYNAERYLSEAIDSVLQQTFTDFELLVIDDGSTDSSASIIRSYSDPRIRFYQNDKNMGLTHTLNKGIGLAHAELIARMDGDDICHPQRLQKQYEYLSANQDCAMVSCWARVVTEDKQFIRQDDFKSRFYYYNMTFECWIYHPTIMVRKHALQQIGGYTVSYSEDYELQWQISRRFKFHNLPEVLLDYRISYKNIDQQQTDSRHDVAQLGQVLRNLKYFMGEDFSIPQSYVECLHHNFDPLLAEGEVSQLVNCLQILDKVTAAMLEKPNPNRQAQAIREAAFHKRRFMLKHFLAHLPRHKALYLMARENAWWYLMGLIKNRLKNGFKLTTFLMAANFYLY